MKPRYSPRLAFPGATPTQLKARGEIVTPYGYALGKPRPSPLRGKGSPWPTRIGGRCSQAPSPTSGEETEGAPGDFYRRPCFSKLQLTMGAASRPNQFSSKSA